MTVSHFGGNGLRLPRRLLIDLTPLRRSRDFRLLVGGELVSVLGNQLTTVAVPFQVYQLTHSSLDVGLVSITQLFPLITGSLLAGSIVDAMDRRRLLMVAQVLMAACSAGLAVNADLDPLRPALWPLFVLPALSAGFSGLDSAGRQAIQGAYLIDINAMVFGMPRALFPALAVAGFGGGATTLGYLYAAPGAGALAGALTTGWVSRIQRQGLAVIVAVIAWGAAITGFGLVRWLPAALLLLA